MRTNALRSALLVAVLTLVGACGGDDDGPLTMTQAEVEDQVTEQVIAQGFVEGTPHITCDGDLVIEVGNTIDCVGTLEEAPGEETPIVVEVLTEDTEPELEVTINGG